MKNDLKPISLVDQVEQKPQMVKTDDNTITVYKVVTETFDIGNLKIEKKGIEEQLSKVLTDEELLAWAKVNYPQPNNIEKLQFRLDEINNLLEI